MKFEDYWDKQMDEISSHEFVFKISNDGHLGGSVG